MIDYRGYGRSSGRSSAALASSSYPSLPTSVLLRHDYQSLATIAQLTMPVLIAHSPSDELIPFAHATSLYEAAAEPKIFYQLNGPHNQSFVSAGAPYLAAIAKFVANPRSNTPAIDDP